MRSVVVNMDMKRRREPLRRSRSSSQPTGDRSGAAHDQTGDKVMIPASSARREGAQGPSVPALAHAIRVRHQTLDRVRFRIPALRQDAALGPRLSAALEGDPRVIAVRANAACASLVVHHQPGCSSPAQLAAEWSTVLAPLVDDGRMRGGAKSQGAIRPGPTPSTGTRRLPVTWPLADLSRSQRDARSGLADSMSQAAATAATMPRRGQAVVRSGVGRLGCWLCALHRWLTRHVLRLSLRCFRRRG